MSLKLFFFFFTISNKSLVVKVRQYLAEFPVCSDFDKKKESYNLKIGCFCRVLGVWEYKYNGTNEDCVSHLNTSHSNWCGIAYSLLHTRQSDVIVLLSQTHGNSNKTTSLSLLHSQICVM